MNIKTFVKNTIAPAQESIRDAWIIKKLSSIPRGKKIIDVGAGRMPYKQYCWHLTYISQDFGKYTGRNSKKGILSGDFDSTKADIISDITDIPVKKQSFDVILCTEVFEHVPNPFNALAELNRIHKKGGTLILTAPCASLTHFYPYFFFSGFSREFYKINLPTYGYRIQELYVYGDYFRWMALEFVRTPFVVFGYNKILALLMAPFIVFAVPWYIFIRLCSRLFPQSKDTLAWGICVVAKKIKSLN